MGVGRTERGPHFAVVTLHLECGLEVLDSLCDRGRKMSVCVSGQRDGIGAMIASDVRWHP